MHVKKKTTLISCPCFLRLEQNQGLTCCLNLHFFNYIYFSPEAIDLGEVLSLPGGQGEVLQRPLCLHSCTVHLWTPRIGGEEGKY